MMFDTVRGQVSETELLFISPHEHCVWGKREKQEALLLKELQRYKELGGSCILEMSTPAIGAHVDRNSATDYLEELSEMTGVHIIYGAGFYKEPRLPGFIQEKSVEELRDMICAELMEGCGKNKRKAGFIGEVGSSNYRVYETEAKALRAAAKASVITGAGISTHTGRGTMVKEQLEIFESEGVSPERVIIGHMDVYPRMNERLDLYRFILDKGATVQFDCAGKEGAFELALDPDYGQKFPYDWQRAFMVKKLLDMGYEKQITISCDVDGPTLAFYNSGWGHGHLLSSFVPLLREIGVSEAQIIQMTRENPKRFLAHKYQ